MTNPLASISMYDWPELSREMDVFWQAIANALTHKGISAPSQLTRPDEILPLWLNPDLLIGQTCGWPYVNKLRDDVIPFARFDYGLPNCPAGYYNSVFIGQHETDKQFLENAESLTRAQRIAINGDDSQSGFHVFREITRAPLTEIIIPEICVISGSHRNSVKAVASGKAQIAAIDAISFELAKRYEPEAASKVVVLGYSKPVPGLPLITAKSNAKLIPELFSSVQEAVQDISVDTRKILGIQGITKATDNDYSVFLANNA